MFHTDQAVHSFRRGILAVAAAITFAWSTPGSLYGQSAGASVLVHLDANANRGLLRAFLSQNGGRIQYQYGILPNLVNVRDLPPGLVTALSQVGGVASVEPDGEVHSTLGQSIPLIHAVQGTDVSFDGSGARVCIIDGGIDKNHPIFGSRVSPDSWDFANQDADPADDSSHGTHVSGIAAGQKVSGNNNTFQGVAPGAAIVAVKALNNGAGSFSDVIAGIDYCAGTGQKYLGVTPQGLISQPADVISMSLGGGRFFGACDSDPAAAASNAAVDHNVVVVAASGNNGWNNSMGTPACGSKVISVGATYDANVGGLAWSTCIDFSTSADKIACFSNGASFLDVVAPGALITSAAIGGGTVTMGGTSQAAPHVAGLATLLRDKDPSLTPAQIRDCIRAGAVDRGPSGFDVAYGYGRIDVKATVNACGSGSPNSAPSVLITSPADNSSFDSGASIAFQGSASDDEDGNLSGSIQWTSNRDGNIGSGALFSKVLTDGTHTIAASITDSGGTTRTNSVTVNVVGVPVPTAPAAPSGLSAQAETTGRGNNKSYAGSVTLRWTDNSNNETQFLIDRCSNIVLSGKGKNQQASCGLWPTSPIGTAAANATSYSDTTAAGGTTYIYRVRSNNDVGPSAPSNEVRVTTP